jgi:hypothetical protein
VLLRGIEPQHLEIKKRYCEKRMCKETLENNEGMCKETLENTEGMCKETLENTEGM